MPDEPKSLDPTTPYEVTDGRAMTRRPPADHRAHLRTTPAAPPRPTPSRPNAANATVKGSAFNPL